jgi:DNA polymerase III epsilon subunit-like protein
VGHFPIQGQVRQIYNAGDEMSHLFLDCETSGLLRRDLPHEAPEQPWIVSIAAELCDPTGNRIAALDTQIRANGRAITAGAEAVHGVSNRAAGRAGISEIAALAVICGKESFVGQAAAIVGHNVSFDVEVIECVLARNGRESSAIKRPGLSTICTMRAATAFCKLPPKEGRDGFKWPSLDEACSILLGEPPREGFHGAWADMQRAKRLYFKLRELGAFEAAACP